MTDHSADLRRGLGQTSAMLRLISAQDREISERATSRAKQVDARLGELRKTALIAPSAADEYLEHTREKGALLRTLAKS